MAVIYKPEKTYVEKVAWKKKEIFYGVITVAILMSILVNIIVLLNTKNHYLTYPLAILMIIGFIWFKRHINVLGANGLHYVTGFRGEARVGEILKQLSDDYSVFADVKLPNYGGNLDFVVVGPTGVFAVEVKNTWRIDEENIDQAMKETIRLHDYLMEQGHNYIFVHPILVYVNPFIKVRYGMKPVRGVMVIKLPWLLKMIEKPNGDDVSNNGVTIDCLKRLSLSTV